MNFQQLQEQKTIKLYAGDIYRYSSQYDSYIGLSLTTEDEKHIKFDLTHKFPISDNSVDIFQSEDVFEHINFYYLVDIINEIYRILKPKALFRLSLPDYNCDVLYKRVLYNYKSEMVFDPEVGGTIAKPEHVWFPTYSSVDALLKKTLFSKAGTINFLHYYLSKDNFITKEIDYSHAYVVRTPDHDIRVQKPYRPMSLVVDCIK